MQEETPESRQQIQMHQSRLPGNLREGRMNFTIGRCKHDQAKYCKNWNGKGNLLKVTSLSVDAVVNNKIKCPPKHKDCPFKVEPKGSGK